MAAQNASSTGLDVQGDARLRNTPQKQANGSYIPKEFDARMDEKTKQKVSQQETFDCKLDGSD